MNITNDEIQNLKLTTNAQEWNRVCDEIKRARDGQYPPDWWSVIMQGGIMHEKQQEWTK